MKILITFLVFSIFACSTVSEPARDKVFIEKTIYGFYDALAKQDFDRMRSLTTVDFTLYEGGDILNNDVIAGYFRDFPKFTVRYTYDSLEIRTDHETANARYFKTAAFVISDTQHIIVKNIETASFRKIRHVWKLELLHTSKRNENP